MKRKLSALLVLLLLLVCCSACAGMDTSREARRIVEREGASLEALAAEMLAAGEVPEKTAVKGVERVEVLSPGWAAFSIGGGMPFLSTPYRGFYYSPGDVPLSYQGADMTLTEKEQGVWTWEGKPDGQGGGDNHYRTGRLSEKWFWFEMYF